MKDSKCELTKKEANKALIGQGERYKVMSFKEKK